MGIDQIDTGNPVHSAEVQQPYLVGDLRGNQLHDLVHQVGMGVDDDDGPVVLALRLAPQLVIDDVLDQRGLPHAGPSQDHRMLPYGGLGQTYITGAGLADQRAGVHVAGAEIAQEGDESAGGDALHGSHLTHPQGQVPDGSGLTGREHRAASPLRIDPAEDLVPADKGVMPLIPVQDATTVVLQHPTGVPGITRRVVEGTDAVDHLLETGTGQGLGIAGGPSQGPGIDDGQGLDIAGNQGLGITGGPGSARRPGGADGAPVYAHDLEFRPEPQGLQLPPPPGAHRDRDACAPR